MEKKMLNVFSYSDGKILERNLLGLSILQCMSVFSPQEFARINSSDSAQRK